MQYTPYWKLETSVQGRMVWKFAPPEPYDHYTEKDWESEKGKELLSAMVADFKFDKSGNPSTADLIYRTHMEGHNGAINYATENADDAFTKAVTYYQKLQTDGGYWAGDYGGPMFLLPGMVIASYITETPLPTPHKGLIQQYMFNHQNTDGGWGMHIEGASTMFGTVLQYVALRLLGSTADESPLKQAHQWIKKHGGATALPLWGKFYLAILGVYEWEGMNSLLPELWLVPKNWPIHPGNYWCHARMVYLPMGYCFGEKVKAQPSPLLNALKEELYLGPYEHVDWKAARNKCAATDLYYPQTSIFKVFNKVLNFYERKPIRTVRTKAMDFALEYIDAEDQQTNYIDIGPVNQVINSIVVWHAYGKNDQRFKKHVERWYDYLWVAEDGMKMNGYNGSQLWDTTFTMQAILAGNGAEKFPETLARANKFIVTSQVREEVKDHRKFYRHDSIGGWPFSTREHGWPITDCTAEGLKTALLIRNLNIVKPEEQVTDEMLKKAATLLLSFQNKNGGWASYELTRGPKWLEALNPSEVFGNIMIDHSYTECSCASIQALLKFRQAFPNYKKQEIETAIIQGISFILKQQEQNGSWYGSWAVCYTYGTWFGVEAICAALKSGMVFKEEKKMAKALQNAAGFLTGHQKADGGWGESFESCIQKKYMQHRNSQIVNTAWALLALMEMDYSDKSVMDKGIELLKSRQMPNGDFQQEGISGVFNHNCGITYTAYRNVFPIWALGKYKTKYADTAP